MNPIFFALLSMVLGAVGQLLMKAGMKSFGPVDGFASLHALSSLANPQLFALLWVGGGLLCYVAAMLIWLGVLKVMDLSRAYPLLSLGYVVVYAGAVSWSRIGEQPTLLRTLGTSVIVGGVMLASYSTGTEKRDE